MTNFFIHLRQYSNYSLLESSFKIEEIVNLCKENKMPAIALTDSQNMFGSFEFSLSCKNNGIQPILGIDLHLEKLDSVEIESKILLLIKNKTGYRNLIKLMSKVYSDNENNNKITLEDLKENSDGLICLTGGIHGPIAKLFLKNDVKGADNLIQKFLSIYKNNLFIELSREGLEDEKRTENYFLSNAHKYNVPIVATNYNLFSYKSKHEATDTLLCIKNVEKLSHSDRQKISGENYFKSSESMIKLFSDLPEAISNTRLIAKKCLFFLEEESASLPKFFNSIEKENSELSKFSFSGLYKKLANYKFSLKQEEFESKKNIYEKRLKYELDVIQKTGYSGYFLIVADFISWAKKMSIPVGPGRGSGAGSLVAWSLNITDLDPIKYKLLFERFLNPERVTLPDFDIDFCQERRDEVLKYVVKKYGKKRVAQIITFGKLQSRNVIRDVGRVLQMPYTQVDNIAKKIPYNPANPITLTDAVNNEKDLKSLKQTDDTVAKLLDISLQLEGLNRHASTHAAGIVISDKDLNEKIPFYKNDPDTGLPVTQFSMHYIEKAGLIKFDFLGLKTLTIINKTCGLIKKDNKKINISNIPLNDIKTFNLLKKGETIGCFQLESSGVQEYLKKLIPDRFDDIVAMISLYRPGPMQYIESYIKRKHGKEDIIYLHPILEPVLKETYGITIYQEQVMQIAQVLAGFTLSQADTLRWAIGKRKRKLMNSLKSHFIEGCKKNNVKQYQAETIFKQVETFAGYGFNKSHAVGYALIAYQTAYLKANFPIEFMTASMNYELNNTDKINKYLDDCKNMNIKILNPNINYSSSFFSIEKNKSNNDRSIRYALSALKNVGLVSTTKIVSERNKNGKFSSINNFCNRIDDENFNIRQFEYLIKSGSFDVLEKNRAKLFNNVEKIVQLIRNNRSNKDQNNLFCNDLGDKDIIDFGKHDNWDKSTKINYEFESLGFYLTEHPLKKIQKFLKKNGFYSIDDLKKETINIRNEEKKFYKISAISLEKNERTSKKGNKYAYVHFSDYSGNFEGIVFSDILSSSSIFIDNHEPLILDLEVIKKDNNLSFRIVGLVTLKSFLQSVNQNITLFIDNTVNINSLKKNLYKYQDNDGSSITLCIKKNKKIINLAISGKFDYFSLLNNEIEGTRIVN